MIDLCAVMQNVMKIPITLFCLMAVFLAWSSVSALKPVLGQRTADRACNGGVHLPAGEGAIIAPRLRPLANGSNPRPTMCVWTITLQHEHQLLQLRFANFILGVGKPKSSCKNSFLLVADGNRRRKLCGELPVGTLGRTGSMVTVRLVHGLKTALESSFSLEYKAVERPPDFPRSPPHQYSLSSALTVRSTANRCNGFVAKLNNFGSFSSPGQNYDNMDVCIWHLQVPEKKRIRLDFTYVDVEYHSRCVYDSIVVCDFKVQERCRYLEAFCGTTLKHFISRERNVLVKMVTDYSVTAGGFSADFSTEDSDFSAEEQPAGNLSNIRCGVRHGEPHAYIVGGQESEAWPFMARLTHPASTSTVCGATILSRYWILTAAHCLYAISSLYSVKAGSHVEGASEVSRAIKDVFIHCEYDPVSLFHDIALIRLNVPLTLSATIWPVCLPGQYEPVPMRGSILGWGLTRSYRGARLREAEIPRLNHTACTHIYSEAQITEDMLCAGDDTKDTCQGDSGGPFLAEVSRQWLQYGVTSWGPPEGCAVAGRPGVYTRVPSYVRWIHLVTDSRVHHPRMMSRPHTK